MLIIKATFRFLSFVSLVLAVLVGVLDSVRSVSTDAIDVMSATMAWSLIWPSSLSFTQGLVSHYLHPEAWRSFHSALSDIPASACLLTVAFVFWLVGYRKQRVRPQVFSPLMT
jgi:hypothetical protein